VVRGELPRTATANVKLRRLTLVAAPLSTLAKEGRRTCLSNRRRNGNRRSHPKPTVQATAEQAHAREDIGSCAGPAIGLRWPGKSPFVSPATISIHGAYALA
jgi:hypothetical protein